MHLIKEHLFGIKKNVNVKPHDDQGRVIVHDQIQVRGDIIKTLPGNFGSGVFAALVAVPVKHVTTFTIVIGSLRVPMDSSMSLNPSLELFNENIDADHDNTFSLIAADGKHIYIRTTTKIIFEKWHRAVREALAELIFTSSFTRVSDGSLSIRKIEMAIQKCKLLVPRANCHMLRASKILTIKLELKQLLSRLNKNPKSVSRDDVQNFLNKAECDRLLLKDSQMRALKELMPQLLSQDALDIVSAPISHNSSAVALQDSTAALNSLTASLQDIRGHASEGNWKSPPRNKFQRSLVEISLLSNRKPVKQDANPNRSNSSVPPTGSITPSTMTINSNHNSLAIMNAVTTTPSCSAVLIDDSDVTTGWTKQWTPSPNLPPFYSACTSELVYFHSSPDLTPGRRAEAKLNARREKRRRNRVMKFHNTPSPIHVATDVGLHTVCVIESQLSGDSSEAYIKEDNGCAQIDLMIATHNTSVLHESMHMQDASIVLDTVVEKDKSFEAPFIELVGDGGRLTESTPSDEHTQKEAELLTEVTLSELSLVEAEQSKEETVVADLVQVEYEQLTEKCRPVELARSERLAEEARLAELARTETECLAEEVRFAELIKLDAEWLAEETYFAELTQIDTERLAEKVRVTEVERLETARLAEKAQLAELASERMSDEFSLPLLVTQQAERLDEETTRVVVEHNREAERFAEVSRLVELATQETELLIESELVRKGAARLTEEDHVAELMRLESEWLTEDDLVSDSFYAESTTAKLLSPDVQITRSLSTNDSFSAMLVSSPQQLFVPTVIDDELECMSLRSVTTKQTNATLATQHISAEETALDEVIDMITKLRESSAEKRVIKRPVGSITTCFQGVASDKSSMFDDLQDLFSLDSGLDSSFCSCTARNTTHLADDEISALTTLSANTLLFCPQPAMKSARRAHGSTSRLQRSFSRVIPQSVQRLKHSAAYQELVAATKKRHIQQTELSHIMSAQDVDSSDCGKAVADIVDELVADAYNSVSSLPALTKTAVSTPIAQSPAIRYHISPHHGLKISHEILKRNSPTAGVITTPLPVLTVNVDVSGIESRNASSSYTPKTTVSPRPPLSSVNKVRSQYAMSPKSPPRSPLRTILTPQCNLRNIIPACNEINKSTCKSDAMTLTKALTPIAFTNNSPLTVFSMRNHSNFNGSNDENDYRVSNCKEENVDDVCENESRPLMKTPAKATTSSFKKSKLTDSKCVDRNATPFLSPNEVLFRELTVLCNKPTTGTTQSIIEESCHEDSDCRKHIGYVQTTTPSATDVQLLISSEHKPFKENEEVQLIAKLDDVVANITEHALAPSVTNTTFCGPRSGVKRPRREICFEEVEEDDDYGVSVDAHRSLESTLHNSCSLLLSPAYSADVSRAYNSSGNSSAHHVSESTIYSYDQISFSYDHGGTNDLHYSVDSVANTNTYAYTGNLECEGVYASTDNSMCGTDNDEADTGSVSGGELSSEFSGSSDSNESSDSFRAEKREITTQQQSSRPSRLRYIDHCGENTTSLAEDGLLLLTRATKHLRRRLGAMSFLSALCILSVIIAILYGTYSLTMSHRPVHTVTTTTIPSVALPHPTQTQTSIITDSKLYTDNHITAGMIRVSFEHRPSTKLAVALRGFKQRLNTVIRNAWTRLGGTLKSGAKKLFVFVTMMPEEHRDIVLDW